MPEHEHERESVTEKERQREGKRQGVKGGEGKGEGAAASLQACAKLVLPTFRRLPDTILRLVNISNRLEQQQNAP